MTTHRLTTLASASFRLTTAPLLVLLTLSSVHAEDKGQWNKYNLTDQQRAWFKNTPQVKSCCDVADGYPVNYEMKDNHYWVHWKGKLISVPQALYISLRHAQSCRRRHCLALLGRRRGTC
jgi:hypothetical protein